jgi:DNA-binding NtrC family response regulator
MNTAMSIMVVDDEMIVRESLYHWLKKVGHHVDVAASGPEALEKLKQVPYELLFIDIKMPGMNGLELLEHVKADYPETIVIIITAYGSIQSAVQAMQTGASEYLLKPFKPDYLSLVMEKIDQQRRLASEVRYVKSRLEEITRFENIIGQSAPMEKIFELIPEVARSDSSVLLTGETGTGKELVAKAIHAQSLRAKYPFIAINCGALPDQLLESELFGHQKGAFTGAVQTRKGFLEVVSGGTLFLDEVGEVSPKMQVDLLRVLEEKTITPVGSSYPVEIDFRLICATRRDLERAIGDGGFRSDFFYRINVIQIQIPPLRDRKDDIEPLAAHFLSKFSQETIKKVDHVSGEAMALLRAYDWPGNVRELENAIERAVVLSKGRRLDVADFSFIQATSVPVASSRSLQDVEKAHILQILKATGWNVTQAARILDIGRSTLHKKIKRYGFPTNR